MPETEPNNAPRSRTFAIRAVATAAVVAALGLAAFMLASPSVRPRAALIGGAFALEKGDGETVSDQTLRGTAIPGLLRIHPLPRRLSGRTRAHFRHSDQDGRQAHSGLFITVDPERDTPKIMQDYVSSFNPAIVGLSGSPQAIEERKKPFGCSPAKVSRSLMATIPWTTVRSST